MEESAVTPLLGLIGFEVAGNPTQFAIERVLQAAKLDWRFLSFTVAPDRLEDAVRGLDALNFRGLAIAPSCSALIFSLLKQHASSSDASRWVDTISRSSSGELIGHNLIAQVLLDVLQQSQFAIDQNSTPQLAKENPAAVHHPRSEVDAEGSSNEELLADDQATNDAANPEVTAHTVLKTAVVLGDTGKSMAMARLLMANKFSSVFFRDVNPSADDQGFIRSTLRGKELSHASVLIRASVSDDDPQVAEVSEPQLQLLPPNCLVVDLATSAGTSPMLRFAQSQGLKTLSLIDLMVMRATRAFQLWTDADPDVNLLREAFEEYLEI